MPEHQFIAGLNPDAESFSWEKGCVWTDGSKVVPQAVIDDDLFSYMYDTFRWVRAQFPNGQWWNGLDSYGYSLIKDRGDIRRLGEIAKAWKRLLELAPPSVKLTGNYGWDGADLQNGRYEELWFEQREIVLQLDNLVKVTEKALKDGVYVIHFGI
ncbi:hypothetical protein [Saccharibacillus alkalitolerans]|uniref:Uncharacterized protein n=1 Tax=Saccharibacillus alkalitolerans TaxID=2705290 RepID=A0ABX0FE55_9BACL|nr:hypothetical protein [Saccharibacillus alkalitolerans]NGZ76962.1 hypothetical protein [Saccharibacillus alkalitolerans]